MQFNASENDQITVTAGNTDFYNSTQGAIIVLDAFERHLRHGQATARCCSTCERRREC